MSTLYEITDEFKQLEQDLLEAGGELTPELEERLNINKDEFQEKMIGYAKMIASKEAENEAIKAEIERLSSHKTTNTNMIARLKERMKQAMLILCDEDAKGIKRLLTPLFKFTIGRSSASEILSEELIPKKYKTIVKEVRINRADILADLRAGKEVKGAVLKESYSLQIR